MCHKQKFKLGTYINIISIMTLMALGGNSINIAHAQDVLIPEQCPLPTQRCITFIPEGVTEGNLYQIGTDSTFAPFVSLSEDKDKGIEGFDVELFKAIAKDQAFAFRMCADEFAKVLESTYSGEKDGVMAGVSYSENRAKKLDYSKPYYQTHLAVVVHDLSNIRKLKDLANKTVVVKKGTLAKELAYKYQKQYNLNIIQTDTSFETFTKVNMGMADFMLEDLPVVENQISSGLYPGLIILDEYFDIERQVEKYYFVVPKNKNGELLAKFNQGLENLKQNGQLDKIVKEHLENAN